MLIIDGIFCPSDSWLGFELENQIGWLFLLLFGWLLQLWLVKSDNIGGWLSGLHYLYLNIKGENLET